MIVYYIMSTKISPTIYGKAFTQNRKRDRKSTSNLSNATSKFNHPKKSNKWRYLNLPGSKCHEIQGNIPHQLDYTTSKFALKNISKIPKTFLFENFEDHNIGSSLSIATFPATKCLGNLIPLTCTHILSYPDID